MLDFANEVDVEEELDTIFSNDDLRHPIQRVVHEGGSLVTATGSTSNACVMCSPSSGTRCGGGFTKCGIRAAA
jgi:hypothetical protein